MTSPHPEPPYIDRLLTPDEVASILQVPKATLYRCRHRGEGPHAMRIGKHLRFRSSAVIAYIDEREGAADGG